MTQPVQTRSEDYGASYYGFYGAMSPEGDYAWEDDNWREFFLRVASRLRAIVDPQTVLDAGCARGLLVQALRTMGVDATGIDISEHAVASAHADVRDHLRVGSLTDDLGGPYDLVTCIEVLEHMSDPEAQVAIDRLCAASDLVLISSTPQHFDEPTHVNVNPTAHWVASFAERGFFRRTDVNVDFLSPWAVLFSRSALGVREVVHRYETQYAALHAEVMEKRQALLEAHRSLVEASAADLSSGDAGLALRQQVASLREENDALVGRTAAAEHQVLRIRDHVVGLEATAGTQGRIAKRAKARLATQRERIEALQAKLRRLQKRTGELEQRAQRAEARARQLQGELDGVLGSRTWRWGRRLARPFGGSR